MLSLIVASCAVNASCCMATNSPWQDEFLKGDPTSLASNVGEDASNTLVTDQFPLEQAACLLATAQAYQTHIPLHHSVLSQSPFGGATFPFGTSLYATPPFLDRSRSATSPTYNYSPTSSALQCCPAFRRRHLGTRLNHCLSARHPLDTH
jgi:hypothetical protein